MSAVDFFCQDGLLELQFSKLSQPPKVLLQSPDDYANATSNHINESNGAMIGNYDDIPAMPLPSPPLTVIPSPIQVRGFSAERRRHSVDNFNSMLYHQPVTPEGSAMPSPTIPTNHLHMNFGVNKNTNDHSHNDEEARALAQHHHLQHQQHLQQQQEQQKHLQQQQQHAAISNYEHHLRVDSYSNQNDHYLMRSPHMSQLQSARRFSYDAAFHQNHHVANPRTQGLSPIHQSEYEDSMVTAQPLATSTTAATSYISMNMVESPTMPRGRMMSLATDFLPHEIFASSAMDIDMAVIPEEELDNENSHFDQEQQPSIPKREKKGVGRPRKESTDINFVASKPKLVKKDKVASVSAAPVQQGGRKHIVVATPENPRPFACELCSVSFARNHDLKRHHRIHDNYRPYVCKICKKTFTRLDALHRHQNVSVGKRLRNDGHEVQMCRTPLNRTQSKSNGSSNSSSRSTSTSTSRSHSVSTNSSGSNNNHGGGARRRFNVNTPLNNDAQRSAAAAVRYQYDNSDDDDNMENDESDDDNINNDDNDDDDDDHDYV